MNNDILVIIDAGHGGKETGAVANGYQEKDLNLAVTLELKSLLKYYFRHERYTRTDDIYIDITERSKWIAEQAKDFNGKVCCLSIHFNAFNGVARGVEVIHSKYAKPDFAQCMIDEILKFGMPFRRIYSRESTKHVNKDYYAMHRLTGKAETVILEPLFLDNKQDIKILRKPNFIKDLANCYLSGLLDYLNIPKQDNHEIEDKKNTWKYFALEQLHDEELLDNLQDWKNKIDEPLSVWAGMLLMNRIYQKLKK